MRNLRTILESCVTIEQARLCVSWLDRIKLSDEESAWAKLYLENRAADLYYKNKNKKDYVDFLGVLYGRVD